MLRKNRLNDCDYGLAGNHGVPGIKAYSSFLLSANLKLDTSERLLHMQPTWACPGSNLRENGAAQAGVTNFALPMPDEETVGYNTFEEILFQSFSLF